jgi:FG-GAP-like repeat/Abnormal spindle-like microcephaly-assoc'd, ASPM-SPD-2-Hydin
VNRTLYHFICAAFLLSIATGVVAQNNAVPLLNQPLTPTSVTPGHGAFTLNVTGSGFALGATVNWNGAPRKTSFVSSSHLQARISSADVAQMGTALVTVTNPAPGGGISNFVYFPVGTQSSTVSFVDNVFALQFGLEVGAIAVADFNNDGKLDLAIANGSTIEILFGNGDATFQPPISTLLNFVNDSGLTCGSISSLIVGDFNGDGKTDLAVGYVCFPFSGSGENLLYMALGTGDGHFVPVGNGTISGGPLASADVNADGSLDVVSTNCDYVCGNWYPAVNLGDGTGNFALGIGLGDTYGFGIPAFGDFDHDGRLDMALPGLDFGVQRELYTFLGNGDGSFQSPGLYPLSGRNWNAGTAAVADLNRDGNLDIITDGLFVFLGNGDGTFNSIGGPSVNAAGVQLGDFNNDNKLDAVLFGYSGSAQAVTSLLGNGDGTFQNPQTWLGDFMSQAFFAIGDFNGDGKLDVISAGVDSTGLTKVSVFLQSTLSVSPAFLSFGAVQVGTRAVPQTSTLTNVGNTTLTIAGIRLLHAGSNYMESSDCGAVLAPGASCTITVVFSPRVNMIVNTSLDISYSGGIGRLQSITLTGSGY